MFWSRSASAGIAKQDQFFNLSAFPLHSIPEDRICNTIIRCSRSLGPRCLGGNREAKSIYGGDDSPGLYRYPLFFFPRRRFAQQDSASIRLPKRFCQTMCPHRFVAPVFRQYFRRHSFVKKFAGPCAQGVLDPVMIPCPMSLG